VNRFRTHLTKLAHRSPHVLYQHAALVAQGTRVLGEGTNSAGLHAETNAIRIAMRGTRDAGDLRGTTVYTLMVKRATGHLGNGAPCARCLSAMREYGIRRVVVYV
jgi:tRNA(Arg) A34 adenosine deaminase TadA